MKTKIIKENLKIEIHHHPHYKSLNDKLMNDFSNLSFADYHPYEYTNIRGSKFNFVDLEPSSIPKGVTLIENWVQQIIQSKLKVPFTYKFATWAARLDKGQETIDHDHLFYATYTFVYFVNTPKGSSPLTFTTSGKKIKAESGKLVLFPSSLRHKVSSNKCDNRVTIASNITILENTGVTV